MDLWVREARLFKYGFDPALHFGHLDHHICHGQFLDADVANVLALYASLLFAVSNRI